MAVAVLMLVPAEALERVTVKPSLGSTLLWWSSSPMRAFAVTLSNASAGAGISTATATGTIRNGYDFAGSQPTGAVSHPMSPLTIDGNEKKQQSELLRALLRRMGCSFVGSAGPDTLSATGPGPILAGGAGVDTLVGCSALSANILAIRRQARRRYYHQLRRQRRD